MPKTAAEELASFTSTTFKDGEPSDGSPTAEELAATEANAASAAAAATDDDENADGDESADGDENADGKTQDGEAAAKEAGATENSEKDGAAKPKEGKDGKEGGKPTANKRIGDLTANWRNAERQADTERTRADRLQAELDAVKSGKAPLTADQGDSKGGDKAPDPSAFEYGELDPKYIAALARHETKQALAADRADEDKTRQAAAADAKRQETAEKADKLTRAGLDLHDDFDEVVMQGAREGKWDLSPTLGELILDSEFGPQIAYELAKDPTESRRVAKLSPSQQAAFFGRQEAKFEAAKPSPASKTPKTSQASPPPKLPKGGSGSNTIGADSTDFAAVEKAWRGGALH